MLIIARKPKTNDQRNKPTIRPYRIPRFHPPHPQKIFHEDNLLMLNLKNKQKLIPNLK